MHLFREFFSKRQSNYFDIFTKHKKMTTRFSTMPLSRRKLFTFRSVYRVRCSLFSVQSKTDSIHTLIPYRESKVNSPIVFVLVSREPNKPLTHTLAYFEPREYIYDFIYYCMLLEARLASSVLSHCLF